MPLPLHRSGKSQVGVIERDDPQKSLGSTITLAASALGNALLSLGGLAYARHAKTGWIEQTDVSIPIAGLPPEFNGYRILQLSDIHMDNWMTAERLSAIVRMINAQKPDLIAMTGDFVTVNPKKYAAGLVNALRNLQAADGRLAVMGNHDHWQDAWVIYQVIRDCGMIDLNNRVLTLRRGSAELHIAGIDDFMEGKARIDHVLAQLPSNGPAILLAHEPDFADISAGTGRFALQLSGHSHGGQVVLPLVGPPYLPRYSRKYPSGLYKIGKMWLYTNRGVGMMYLHLRFNSRPEITVFTLTPAREG